MERIEQKWISLYKWFRCMIVMQEHQKGWITPTEHTHKAYSQDTFTRVPRVLRCGTTRSVFRVPCGTRNGFSVKRGILGILLLLDVLLDVAILGIGGGGRSGLFSAQVNALGEVEEEDEFDAASRRLAGTVVHLSRNELRHSWLRHRGRIGHAGDVEVCLGAGPKNRNFVRRDVACVARTAHSAHSDEHVGMRVVFFFDGRFSRIGPY